MEHIKDFKDFLWLPYLCANLLGINVNAGRGTVRFKLQIVATFIGIINHLYLMVGELIYFHQNFGAFASLLEATKTGVYIAYGFNTNAKVFGVLWDLTRLRNVLRTTEALYPKSATDKLAYRVNENFWSRFIYLLFLTYFTGAWIIYFLPGIKSIYEYLKDGGTFSYKTPFWVAHPFDYRSKVLYGLVYFSELWGGHLCVCSNVGIDMVMCCLSRQMCMHFKYIGQQIERYRPTGKAEDSVFLAKLIERHQLILKLCLDLNEIFGVSLVFSIMSASGIICLSAFQVTFEGFGIEFIKFLLLFISALGQMGIVCRFGDELITCSLSIGESVFKHPWYNGDSCYRQLLLVLILRSQKPATLIAKGFSVISLVTFKQVVIMSYRIFALLNTFQSSTHTVEDISLGNVAEEWEYEEIL